MLKNLKLLKEGPIGYSTQECTAAILSADADLKDPGGRMQRLRTLTDSVQDPLHAELLFDPVEAALKHLALLEDPVDPVLLNDSTDSTFRDSSLL